MLGLEALRSGRPIKGTDATVGPYISGVGAPGRHERSGPCSPPEGRPFFLTTTVAGAIALLATGCPLLAGFEDLPALAKRGCARGASEAQCLPQRRRRRFGAFAWRCEAGRVLSDERARLHVAVALTAARSRRASQVANALVVGIRKDGDE